MNIKKHLQSLGLVEVETSTSPKPQPVPTAAPPLPAHDGHSASPPLDQLSAKLMAEVNSAAPESYFKFQEMLHRMSGIPGMSDPAKRQAAAAAVGITDQEIAKAVDAMLQRLAQEETEYAAVIAAGMQERVVSKRVTVDSLHQQVASLEAEIAQSAADIQSGAQTFKQAVEHVRVQIEKMR